MVEYLHIQSVNTKEEPIESTNPFGNDEDEDDESNPFSDPTPPDRYLTIFWEMAVQKDLRLLSLKI
jgi:hypothetical protein